MDNPDDVIDITLSLYKTDEEKLYAIARGAVSRFEKFHGKLEVQGKLNSLLFITVTILGIYKRRTAGSNTEEIINKYYKLIISTAKELGIQGEVSELARYMNDKFNFYHSELNDMDNEGWLPTRIFSSFYLEPIGRTFSPNEHFKEVLKFGITMQHTFEWIEGRMSFQWMEFKTKAKKRPPSHVTFNVKKALDGSLNPLDYVELSSIGLNIFVGLPGLNLWQLSTAIGLHIAINKKVFLINYLNSTRQQLRTSQTTSKLEFDNDFQYFDDYLALELNTVVHQNAYQAVIIDDFHAFLGTDRFDQSVADYALQELMNFSIREKINVIINFEHNYGHSSFPTIDDLNEQPKLVEYSKTIHFAYRHSHFGIMHDEDANPIHDQIDLFRVKG